MRVKAMAHDSCRLEAEVSGHILVADAKAEVEVFSSFASPEVLVEASELSHDCGPNAPLAVAKACTDRGPDGRTARSGSGNERTGKRSACSGQVDLEGLQRIVTFEISVEIPITRRGQSGPAHSDNSLAKSVEQAFRPLRLGLAVIVQSGDDRCPSCRRCRCCGLRQATVDRMANNFRAVGRRQFRTVVGRAVVDDDQLELVSEGLPLNGGQTPAQPRCSIQRAKNDTDAESTNIG